MGAQGMQEKGKEVMQIRKERKKGRQGERKGGKEGRREWGGREFFRI